MDPLFQTLVESLDCAVTYNNEKAVLPQTYVYTATARIDSMNDPHYVRADTSLRQDLDSVVNSAIFASGYTIDAKCSTGNCTFPDLYSTLAYCSVCEDSSADIKFGETCGVELSDPTSETYTNSCVVYSIELPSGLKLNFSIDKFDLNPDEGGLEVSMFTSGILPQTPNRPDLFSAQFIARQISTSANSYGPLPAPLNTTLCGPGNWTCQGYGAATCTLQPCIREYNATVVAGRLFDNLTADSGSTPWVVADEVEAGSMPSMAVVDTNCITTADKTSLQQQGYKVDNPPSRWIPYAVPFQSFTHTEDITLLKPLLHEGCSFMLDGSFHEYLASALEQNFNGTVKAQTTTDVDMSLASFFIVLVNGSSGLRYIYNYGSVDFQRIDSTFLNLSNALTNYIRTHGDGEYPGSVTGLVHHYATCLDVRWAWIAFPAALDVLTILFFVLTVVKSSRHKTPVWKSSSLPWVLAWARPDTDADAGGTSSAEQTSAGLDRLSKDVHVTLQNSKLHARHKPPEISKSIVHQ